MSIFDENGVAVVTLKNGECMVMTTPDGNVPRYTVAMMTGEEADAECRWYLEFDTETAALAEWDRWKDY